MAIVAGWGDDALVAEVIVTPRRAFPPAPDLIVIERPGWLQIVTPSITTGGLNEVIHAAITAPDVDAVIDAAIAEYHTRGLRHRWNLGPGFAPADLPARLERRGLTASWGRAMARAIDGDLPVPEVEIAPVDAGNVDLFTQVMATGWALEPGPLRAINRLAFAGRDARQRGFIAYRGGAPVAVASYVAFARSAYLMGAVTLPAHRGHGLYRALVAARLIDARARGLALATSHARESTSAPILERLGFASVCRFPMYYGAPPG